MTCGPASGAPHVLRGGRASSVRPMGHASEDQG